MMGQHKTASFQGLDDKGKFRKVRFDGEWYYIGHDVDISTWKQGDTISFEWNPSKNDNRFKWLNGWGPAQNTPAPQASSPQTGLVSPSPSPAGPDSYIRPEHLACISNFLAHAVNSALIVKPEDVAKWVYALRDALEHEGSPF